MDIPVTQWRTNLYGRVYIDTSGDGISQEDEPGLPLAPYNIRYRDGAYMGLNNTDLAGYAGFNEVFPLLNWLVVDIDNPRHKLTKIHTVYDAGGQVDATGKVAEYRQLERIRHRPRAHCTAVPGVALLQRL